MMMMDEDENEDHCIVNTDMIELYVTSEGFISHVLENTWLIGADTIP